MNNTINIVDLSFEAFTALLNQSTDLMHIATNAMYENANYWIDEQLHGIPSNDYNIGYPASFINWDCTIELTEYNGEYLIEDIGVINAIADYFIHLEYTYCIMSAFGGKEDLYNEFLSCVDTLNDYDNNRIRYSETVLNAANSVNALLSELTRNLIDTFESEYNFTEDDIIRDAYESELFNGYYIDLTDNTVKTVTTISRNLDLNQILTEGNNNV